MPDQPEFIQTQMDKMADEKDDLYWHTDKAHTSNKDQTVIEREYSGEVPRGEPQHRFWGVGSIIVNMQLPDGRAIQREHVFEFPIRQDSLRKAFMAFEATKKEASEKEMKKLQAEVDEMKRKQASQLVVPSGAGDIKGLRA